MITKNKKGAMEMSVGTIVTIVLLMSVLVLGIFMIKGIFDTSNDAVGAIDDQLNSQINELFSDNSEDLILFPTSGKIIIKKDDDPKGAVFQYRNPETETKTFVWTVEASDTYDYEEKCGSTVNKEIADRYLIQETDKMTIRGTAISKGQEVFFQVPKTAISCTLIYRITINDEEGQFYDEDNLYVTIK